MLGSPNWLFARCVRQGLPRDAFRRSRATVGAANQPQGSFYLLCLELGRLATMTAAGSARASPDAVAASLRAAHRSRDGARASGGARFAGLVRASGRRRLGLARCHRAAKRRDALPLAEISVRQGSGSSLRVVS